MDRDSTYRVVYPQFVYGHDRYYYQTAREPMETIPDLRGMCGMDAISILENMGVEVEVRGNGKVRRQSVTRGTSVKEVKRIVLELS